MLIISTPPPNYLTTKTETMEFKGTKGKWFISGCPFFEDEENNGTFDIITEGRKEIITKVPAYSFWGQTFESAKANALLISKAPEMLELLNELLLSDSLTHEQNEKCLKLIKEATAIKQIQP